MNKLIKSTIALFITMFTFYLMGAEQRFYLGYDTISIAKTQQLILGNNYLPFTPDLQYTIPNPPGGTMFYTYVNGGWRIQTFEDFEPPFVWYPNPEEPFGQGGAGIIFTGTNFNLILCGKIPVGEVITVVSNFYDPNIYRNFTLLASKLPVEGKLTTDLGFQPRNGDIIYTQNGVGQYGNIAYQVYLYDQLVGGWWPSEPVIKKNEGFWHRSLTYGNIVWKQKMFDETNDGRDYSIYDAGYYDFVGGNLLYVSCTQKAGETLVFEYLADLNSSPYQFAIWSPPSSDQTTTANWTAKWGWERGIIRLRAIKP